MCTYNDSGFTCVCNIDYTGLLCETEVDHCIDNECVGGQCINSQTGYTCNCNLGYSGDYCDIPPGNYLCFLN